MKRLAKVPIEFSQLPYETWTSYLRNLWFRCRQLTYRALEESSDFAES